MGSFRDAQGQLTPKFEFEMLWLSLLPVRVKKVRSKIKALEWQQDFPHHNPMGTISCHGNHSSDLTQILMQPFRHSNNVSDTLWLRSAYLCHRYQYLKVWTDIRRWVY